MKKSAFITLGIHPCAAPGGCPTQPLDFQSCETMNFFIVHTHSSSLTVSDFASNATMMAAGCLALAQPAALTREPTSSPAVFKSILVAFPKFYFLREASLTFRGDEDT